MTKEVNPIKLTTEIKKRISKQIYYSSFGAWGFCNRFPVRSDKYCDVLGYMRCDKV